MDCYPKVEPRCSTGTTNETPKWAPGPSRGMWSCAMGYWWRVGVGLGMVQDLCWMVRMTWVIKSDDLWRIIVICFMISPYFSWFMDQLRHVTTILMASDVPIDPIIGWGTLAVGFQRLRRIGRHQDRYSEIVLCLKCGPEIGLFPPYPPMAM